MSLLTQAYLLERYGPRLNVEQVAAVLGLTVVAVHNARHKGTLGLRMYTDAGKLWADYRDVASYLDEVRAAAA